MWHLARLIGFGGALALLLALTSEDVLAQKKDKKGNAKDEGNPALPADYLQLNAKKEIVGTILNVGAGGKTVALRVEFPHWEPNPNFKGPKDNVKLNPQNNQQMQLMKRYQDLMRQMEQAKRAKSPQEQQRAMQRVQMEMVKLQMQMQQQYMPKDGKNPAKANPNNEPFRLVTTSKDFEFEVQDNAVFRKMFLTFEYDDTGNPKQYTEKEKAELRGDDKTKPGYKARLDEVIPGTEARLILTPVKAKKKGEDDGVGNVERPTVNMIVLTKDSPVPGIVGADPKKAKKDKK